MSSRRAVPREADMSDEKAKRPETKGCGEGEWRVKKSVRRPERQPPT